MKLKRKDRVAILSPSSTLAGTFPWVFEQGLERLKTVFELEPVIMPNCLILNATQQDRADDLHKAFHTPVLLNEVLTLMQVKPGEWYIDATAGGGGHTEALLEQGGNVLALDQDIEAIAYLSQRLKTFQIQNRLRVENANFTEIKKHYI